MLFSLKIIKIMSKKVRNFFCFKKWMSVKSKFRNIREKYKIQKMKKPLCLIRANTLYTRIDHIYLLYTLDWWEKREMFCYLFNMNEDN